LIAEAVAREVKEETGLEVEVGELLGVFEVVGDAHFVILDHIATVVSDHDPMPSGDADDARWVRLDEIQLLECTPRFEEALRGWGVLP
jgi:ADP-ribose pyrophosphatase YjhB (NUDIX family)